MLIPRHNRFRVELPQKMLPEWAVNLYKDILKDAELNAVYSGSPIKMIAESLTGISMPGVHVTLVEQEHADAQHNSSFTTYWPKGTNAMRVLDDNEFALEFRFIDGFINYFALRDAIEYMADDRAQSAQGETYKSIGNLVVYNHLTDNYVIKTIYQNVVYSNIDGVAWQYAQQASEQRFTVRVKFVTYTTELYYKDVLVSSKMYNHNVGN